MTRSNPLKTLLALLRERWLWWAVPMAVMLALTIWLLATADSAATVQPFQYGLRKP